MSQDFMKSKLPKVYKKAGQDAYLDPIRQKLIYVTPEETVRQHLISYLIENLQVPKNLISVEEPLSHYEIKTRDRADIIINAYDKTQENFYPVAVIECKAPEIFLDEKAFNQVANYADKLCCNYCWLTNGADNFCYCFDEGKNDYVKIEEFPKYPELLEGEYLPAPVEDPPPRIEFDELEKFYLNYVDEGSIGENTPKKFAVPMVNFFECLLDVSHKLPNQQYKIFELVEDYGIRLLSVGNSSGGKFDSAYRSFIINYNGDEKFVSISISSYCTEKNPTLKTVINVAIDRETDSHHSLECVVDNNFEVIGNKIKFYHNGRITKGQGALKVDDLRKLVSEKYPPIIDGKKFYLGTLTHNRLWYLDDPEVMQVIENLISYALIRDDYREICS